MTILGNSNRKFCRCLDDDNLEKKKELKKLEFFCIFQRT